MIEAIFLGFCTMVQNENDVGVDFKSKRLNEPFAIAVRASCSKRIDGRADQEERFPHF